MRLSQSWHWVSQETAQKDYNHPFSRFPANFNLAARERRVLIIEK